MSSSSTSVKQFNLPILREAVDYPRWEQAVKGALFERGWESILQPLVSKQEEYKQTEYDSDAAAARAMANASNESSGSTQLTPDQQRALVIDQLGASAAAEAKHRDTCTKAYGLLLRVVDQSIYLLFDRECASDGQRLWWLLKTHYSKSSPAEVNAVRQKLNSIRLGREESIESYIGRLSDCFDRLAAQQEGVTEQNKLFHVLEGLNAEYESVKTLIQYASVPYTYREAVKHISTHHASLLLKRRGSAAGTAGQRSPAAVSHENLMYSHASHDSSSLHVHPPDSFHAGAQYAPSSSAYYSSSVPHRFGQRGGYRPGPGSAQARFGTRSPSTGYGSGSTMGTGTGAAPYRSPAGFTSSGSMRGAHGSAYSSGPRPFQPRTDFGQVQCSVCNNFGHSSDRCRPQPFRLLNGNNSGRGGFGASTSAPWRRDPHVAAHVDTYDHMNMDEVNYDHELEWPGNDQYDGIHYYTNTDTTNSTPMDNQYRPIALS